MIPPKFPDRLNSQRINNKIQNLKDLKSLVFIRRRVRKLLNKSQSLLFFFQANKNKHIIKHNLNEGIFAIEIYSYMGIGANLVWALEIMAYCDEKGLIPQFKFTNPGAKKKENNFENYFEIRHSLILNRPIRFAKMRKFQDLNLDIKWNYNSILDLELAQKLITKYLIIKKDVQKEVAEFQTKHFKNKKVLGVHYRGTDKKSEAPLLSYDSVERNINFYLTKYPDTDCIFVSSDDKNFITYIENCSITLPVIYNDDTYRSINNLAIHASGQNQYNINRDAIINCLLLSHCDTLMKTASLLSDWSKLFNPELPLIMLSQPFNEYQFFPGKELAKNILYDPII